MARHFLRERFKQEYSVLWGNLSRLTGVLIVANLSMFFLTGEVTTHGYYYPVISLALLLLVGLGLVAPFGLLDKLWYYCLFICAELIAVYFLAASVVYWLRVSAAATL